MAKAPGFLNIVFWCVMALCLGASTGSAAWGQNWSRFRGPNGSGVSPATTVPVKWTSSDLNWKVELPGPGAASPVIHGDHIYVVAANTERGERAIQCYSTVDGELLWRHVEEFSTYKKHRNNSFASSTPTTDDQHVYVLWQSKQDSPLIALSHDGEEKWRYDLGPYLHGQGGGTSPVIAGDLVVVCNDHATGSFLVALNRETGKEVWKVPRQGKRACYATPCLRTSADGTEELVFSHCFEGVTGVEAKTGELRWHVDVFGRFAQRAVGSPIVWKDLVFANSGAALGEKNLVAIRPESPKGQGTEAVEVYRVDKQAPHVPTALVFNDRLYLWSDAGIATCVDAATGKKIWQSRVGGSKYFGSPICVGGRLYNIDEAGVMRVLATGDAFQLLGESDLKDTCRSTPAVAGGVLYVRTERWLHSVGGPKR